MPSQTWLIVGASRGIGLEFVSQLLARGDIVIATARAPPSVSTIALPSLSTSIAEQTGSLSASNLWPLIGGPNGKNLTILECDVCDEKSVKGLADEVGKLGMIGGVLSGGKIDVVVVNAGVLVYPGRIGEITFSSFTHQLQTNTIGPLMTAQHLLALSSPSPAVLQSYPPIHIRTIVFTSSDSGSTTNFRAFEDGFGAYAASKAALNQGLRHLAAEVHRGSLIRQVKAPVVLAIHPGEVSTDMASEVSLDWEVEGIISPKESIACMLTTIADKGYGGNDEGGRVSSKREGRRLEDGEASFWTWEGRRYPW